MNKSTVLVIIGLFASVHQSFGETQRIRQNGVTKVWADDSYTDYQDDNIFARYDKLKNGYTVQNRISGGILYRGRKMPPEYERLEKQFNS